MTAKWARKWNLPKFWRLRAMASDGVSVTLGRYETEEQAQAECAAFAARGIYRHLDVQSIEPAPEAAAPAAPLPT
jgi:hypothetical protein